MMVLLFLRIYCTCGLLLLELSHSLRLSWSPTQNLIYFFFFYCFLNLPSCCLQYHKLRFRWEEVVAMIEPNRHKVQAFLFIMVGCNFQSVTLWTSTHGGHCYDQESVHCYKGMPCTSFLLIPHLPLSFHSPFNCKVWRSAVQVHVWWWVILIRSICRR